MTRLQVEGQLYTAGKSASLDVLVSFNARQIVVEARDSREPLHHMPLDGLKISDRLGNVPRDIIFPNKDKLTLPGNDEVDRNLAHHNTKMAVSGLEKSKLMALLSLLLVPLSLWAMFKYLIPWLAIGFADYVPEAYSATASRHTLQALDQTLLSPSELTAQTRQRYLDDWQQTMAKLDLQSRQYRILFRQSEVMQANAFALPDGTIVITDAMVELVAEHPDLLLAILLHEIGHVEHRHSMRLIAQSLASSVAISYFFGDLSGMIELFGGASATILQNRFSQQLEWQADNYALAQLDALALPRDTFARAMEKLQALSGKESKLSVLMSSHPLMEARINNARR